MTAKDRKCPAPNCQERIPRKYFCCRSHWFSISKPLRDRVLQTYTKGQEHNLDLITDAYILAHDEALDFLRDAAKPKPPFVK